MGTFLGESDFEICPPDYETISDYYRMPPLHNPYWSEDDIDSSDDDDDDSYDDDPEHDLLPYLMAPQELFSVVNRITTQ